MKDQISALVDGEVSLENSEHLLTAIAAGGEPGLSWATYHLIGDAMRNTPMFKPDFTAAIMAKLDAEPTVLAPKAKRVSKLSSGWSIAASMAAVMFVGWMVMQQQLANDKGTSGVEIAQAEMVKESINKFDLEKNIPSEYLLAHQSYVPSNSAYIQPAAYAESAK